MKKSKLIYLFIFILFLSIIKISIAQEDPSDVSKVISSEFDIPQDKIPTDPDQIKQLYLKERWTKVINNSKALGPIHKLLLKMNNYHIFKIFLNYDYEVSFKFFIVLFIWIVLVIKIGSTINSAGWIKSDWELPYFVGMLATFALAHLNIINVVVSTMLDLLFKQENWWWRSIIIVIIFGIFAALHVISKMVEKKMKDKRKEKIDKETEHKLKVVSALTQGVKDSTSK